MTAIASTDVTVTVNDRRIVGKKRRNRVTIAFDLTTLTYPAGGVAMPAFGSFGMIRNLEFLHIYDESNADGFLYKYDATNNKVRIYRGGFTGGPSAAGDSVSGVKPLNTAGTEGAFIAMGVATGGLVDTGPLVEIVTTGTISGAKTLVAEAVGW